MQLNYPCSCYCTISLGLPSVLTASCQSTKLKEFQMADFIMLIIKHSVTVNVFAAIFAFNAIFMHTSVTANSAHLFFSPGKAAFPLHLYRCKLDL